MGFHHVGRAGLKLLTSGDPLASASQSVRITDVSHHARPELILSVVVGFFGGECNLHVHFFFLP